MAIIATVFGAFSAQSQTLSVTLGQVTVPDDHTIHLTATSTGMVSAKGFQFRKMGTTAWTTTGFTAPFSADITNLTNGKWEYRAFVKGTSDTVFTVTQFVLLKLCCEATAGIIYPPVPTPAEICAMNGGAFIKGVCWASANVDAPNTFAATPEAYGMFYQWNRPIAWSSSDSLVSSDGSSWDKSYLIGTEWTTANDVCPSGWRVPTQLEIQSLVSASYTWVTSNGINGMQFTDGSNSLFLPAVGDRDINGTLLGHHVGLFGRYWSSMSNNFGSGYDLSISNGFASSSITNGLDGESVRCVAK